MKDVVCKHCGKVNSHQSFQCWQNPKKKKPLQSHKTSSNKPKPSKQYKLTSSTKNRRKTAVNRLDRIVSEYVRLYYADKKGLAYCYTCGVRKYWKEMDCGHFIKRGNIRTRFKLENLRVQCQACNRYKSGNYEVYERKLRNELGEEEFDKLIQLSKSQEKVSTIELETMLVFFRELLGRLKDERQEKGYISV